MKIILQTLLILMLITSNTYAGVSDHMEDFWDSLGTTSNVTNPGFVKGQKAGHLTFGGVQMRAKSQNVQLASMRLPSFKAGCGGIDFYAGGFSFIDSDQLVAMMKSIGSNSMGLLAQMAISKLSPNLDAQIKYFQNLAKQVNDLNINSCNAAKSILNDPMGAFNTAKSHACRVGGAASSWWKDGASAMENCSSGGRASETVRSLPKEMKDQFPVDDINIAWKSLKDSGMLDFNSSQGIELAELIMTLSGTVIIESAQNDNQEPKITRKHPTIDEGRTINALLQGGNVELLKCDNHDKCLTVVSTGQSVDIKQENSYLGKVSAAIEELGQAIKNDDPSSLSTGTYKLLSFSTIPIHKILNTHYAYYDNKNEVGAISEFLALDILYGYLDQVNQTMRKAAAKYDKEPYNKVFESFFSDQKEIKDVLHKKRATLYKQFENHLQIIQRTHMIEQMLEKDVSNRIKFGGNL